MVTNDRGQLIVVESVKSRLNECLYPGMRCECAWVRRHEQGKRNSPQPCVGFYSSPFEKLASLIPLISSSPSCLHVPYITVYRQKSWTVVYI